MGEVKIDFIPQFVTGYRNYRYVDIMVLCSNEILICHHWSEFEMISIRQKTTGNWCSCLTSVFSHYHACALLQIKVLKIYDNIVIYDKQGKGQTISGTN